MTGPGPAAHGRRSIGVFGGTFDPPHVGHLIVAQDAALALGLDRILFIPAAVPPHKQGKAVSPAEVRVRMLHLAVGNDPLFGVDTLELERSGASYTADTLRELSARDADVRWTLLIGADQYEEFATWREPDTIRGLARVAVLERGGRHGAAERSGGESSDSADPQLRLPSSREIPGGDIMLDVTRIDVSATAIRQRVAAGLSIRYLVPAAVEEFIFEKKLYVRNGTPVKG